MKELFDSISNESATLITKKYSTSFSIAVRLLAPDIRQAIYNIYGFVPTICKDISDAMREHGFDKVHTMLKPLLKETLNK